MDSTREGAKITDGTNPADILALAAGRQSAVPTRHLTVDSCGSPVQRHLWARHAGRPGQPLVARLRVRPQMQLSCPEPEAAAMTGGVEVGPGSASDGVDRQHRSPSSDGGLSQHRRRRLVLKAINRSWPTSTSATPPCHADPRSVADYFVIPNHIFSRSYYYTV